MSSSLLATPFYTKLTVSHWPHPRIFFNYFRSPPDTYVARAPGLNMPEYATYMYAVKNKLSYQATSELLHLMRIHLPSPNSFPKSFFTLKKHLSAMTALKLRRFCSKCLEELSSEQKQCNKRNCRHSSICYYAVLPFQEHLKHIYSGKLK